MSLFTSSLLDDFNRTTGLGANWSGILGQNTPGILSNTRMGFGGSPGAPFAAYYNAAGPFTDCEVFCTDGGHASNGGGIRLLARVTSPATASAAWYFCAWSGSPGGGGLTLGRDGVAPLSISGSQLARSTTAGGTNGVTFDQIGFRVYDQVAGALTVTVLEGWALVAGDTLWRNFARCADSDQVNRLTSGYAGAGGFASFTGERTAIDDFHAGSISGASIDDDFYDHIFTDAYADDLSKIVSDGHCGLSDRGKASKDTTAELAYSRWPLPLVPGSPFRGMGGGVHVL